MNSIIEPERKTFNGPRGEFSYLHWNKAPKGAPVLHFSHANGFNAYTYRHLLAPLADKLEIYALDDRGHGLSSAPADPAQLKNWDTYRNDQTAFFESLDKPIYLAGHSRGAVVGMQLASSRPDMVKGLLMIEPVIFPYGWMQLWKIARLSGLHHKIPIAKRAARRKALWPDTEAIFKRFSNLKVFATIPEEYIRDYIEGGSKTLPDGQIALSCKPAWEAASFASVSHNSWSRAKKVKCPSTCIYGLKSDTFLADAASRLARTINGIKMLGIEGATHFVAMEHAETVRREMLSLCGVDE